MTQAHALSDPLQTAYDRWCWEAVCKTVLKENLCRVRLNRDATVQRGLIPLDNTFIPGTALDRTIRLSEPTAVRVAGADEVDGHTREDRSQCRMRFLRG